MNKYIKYFLFISLLGLVFILTNCGNIDKIDYSKSDTLNYDEFISELIKNKNITVNFKNSLAKLSKDEDSKFKVINSNIKVSSKYATNISFYCYLDNETEKPKRVLYTHLDTDKKLFHGQIFQSLNSNGDIEYIIDGDFYDRYEKPFLKRNKLVDTKVSVLNKRPSNKVILKEKKIILYEPGLTFDSSLNDIDNDFSLSRNEESTINYHILGSPRHYKNLYYSFKINFN